MATVTDLLKSTGNWALDQDRSSFTFKNKAMWGLANVKGRFTEFSGGGSVDADGSVSGKVDIKAQSVSTGIKKRDEHLRSADFFDAEHHPDITITVSGVDPSADGDLNVRADLTIRGNTVALPMRVKAQILDDGAVRLAATTTVEREQLDVSGNMAGSVGKTATLSADAVFRREG
jgi:polyisoprenoid-binding protein YceI